jgi:hypothetical protein
MMPILVGASPAIKGRHSFTKSPTLNLILEKPISGEKPDKEKKWVEHNVESHPLVIKPHGDHKLSGELG